MNEKVKSDVYNHLIKYKRQTLKIHENGVWWSNKKEYEHIIPEDPLDKNIINSNYHDALANILPKTKRHPGFNHLNSSQALALNLFGPFVIEKKINLIAERVYNSIEVIGSDFEYVYDEVEGTNFDFYIKGKNQDIFFEVKYTEDNFASAKKDSNHIAKYDSVYKERLSKICSIERDEFFSKYQLLRNVIYSNKGFIVFVIPEFRTDLSENVKSVKHLVNCPEKILKLSIDEICRIGKEDTVLNSGGHYDVFYEKYLDIEFRQSKR